MKSDFFNKKTSLSIRVIFVVLLSSLMLISIASKNNIANKLVTKEIETNYNTHNKLDITGVYGDNQSYHPKVLYFKDGWNGYKYWMSFTPYPFADSSKENPHIAVSNNMINWTEPEKEINPLDEVTNPDNNTRYNSDSHLVYNDDLKQLECWWRYVDDEKGTVTIYRRITKDGINWSQKEIIYENIRKNNDWISPTIIYEDGKYKIWYVFKEKIYFTESTNLTKFSKPRLLNIKFEDNVKAWHLDVIHTEKGYEMIIVSFTDWEHRAFMNLYYTISKDNKNYDMAKTILSPSTGSNYWDNSGLYRSSFIYNDNKYYLFYSGQGTDNAKGIGLMYGEDIFDLKEFLN